MLFRITFLVCLLAGFASSALAVDRDQDGLDDSQISVPIYCDVGDIAVVDTGDYSVSIYISRLGSLGYTVASIPPSSTLEDLLDYSLVILPVGHGNGSNHAHFAALASDYISYVSAGGGLWVGQPNPHGMPGNQAVIPWVPYTLELASGYDQNDCPTVTVDPNHCITQDLPNTNFSTAFDTVLDLGPEWMVLAVGPLTGYPGTVVAAYGAGMILVELTHPSPSSYCPMDDEALDRYVACTIGGVIANETSSWGMVKSLYR